MKKILSVFFLLTFLVLPALAIAETTTAPTIFATGNDLIGILDTVANWAFAILLGLAAVVLIVGGIEVITAQGDSTKIATARLGLIWALVGVGVGVAAKGLVAVVKSILMSGSGVGD